MRIVKICSLAMALAFAGMMVSSAASAAPARSASPAWALQNQQPATPQHATPQQSNPDQSAQQPQASPNDQGPAASAQLFVGKITQQSGQYVLYVAASRTTYQLDDQAKAKQFVGQDVKVQGVLDASSNTIKVSDIQPASSSQ
ncbi:MAG: DUF5818 domain-containing protein [Terriglobia bacterium]